MVISPSFASENESARFSAAPPAGFDQLEAERELVLDVYYGGKKRGTARVAVFGDRIQFMDARQALSFIDDARPGSGIADLLDHPLNANRSLACGLSAPSGCGILKPGDVGVVLDEDRFRIDIFVSPLLRALQTTDNDAFLAPPPKKASLVSLFGGTISGSTGIGQPQYRMQNRTIAAFGSYRVRSDLSVERGRGLSFDNLVAEADRGDWRVSAGEFWVPGSDLISRRKIIGAGISSQFDTRRSKEQFYGTPVEVFLDSPARVEVIVDGHLIASQVLSAGNRLLDTANWPSGSYDALIRVFEQGRAPREEHRFFSRDEAMAPLGHPLFQLFGGAYSNGSSFRGAIGFLQAGAGYRLTKSLGLRGMAIAVRDKVVADFSMTAVTPLANFTAGALASSKGDAGVVFRGYTTAIKGVSASFDLRKMHTRGDGPLLPESDRAGTFDPGVSASLDRGDFLQLTGQVSARIRQATVRFSGYFRSSPNSENSYSFGPSLDVPIFRSSRFNIVAEADARRTNSGFSGYAGIRLLLTDGPRGLSVRGGLDSADGRPARLRGEVQGSVNGESGASKWSANAALGRADDTTYARAGGELRSAYLNARGEVLKDFGANAQYSLTTETGIILSSGHAAIAGGEIKDSAVVATVSGDEESTLDVFVNQAKVGTTSALKPLVLYLEPYREYDVQARPHNADLLGTDFSPRKITAYPGSVADATWEVSRLFVAFGRLLDSSGNPLAGAQVTGSHGIAQSDDEGYFQLEVGRMDKLAVVANGLSCDIAAPKTAPRKGYLKLGDVTCR